MRLRTHWLVVVVAVPIMAYAAFLISRPLLERRIRLRLGREAASAGFSATIGELHLTPGFKLELRDVVLERTGRLQIATHALDMRPRVSLLGLVGRAATVSFGTIVLRIRPGVELDIAPSRWVLESPWEGLRLSRLAPGEELELVASRVGGKWSLGLRAKDVRLSGFASLVLLGCSVLEPGRLDAEARIEENAEDSVAVVLRARFRGLAVASLATLGEPRCPTGFGVPTDVAMDAEAAIRPHAGSLHADRFRLTSGDAVVSGRLEVTGGWKDPRMTLDLDVARLELARVLVTAGLDLPVADLGSAALNAHVSGRLFDPATLAVRQRLDFTPPERVPPALARLQAPFVHSTEAFDGRVVTIAVWPDSPDFVPLKDVPPLFLRALLIAEDASFYRHPGIDLSELPAAMAKNVSQGAFVRGASTISQQLAKNLFLSKKKTVGRKLEEAALALLLDATLGKERLLEIYLNVVEWGPGVYGLRPAAHHYFAVEPSALTPKQMVFLVSLLPGPVKYQRSFEGGVPTPFFDGLMATLLGKLVSVGALSETEYAAALAAPLGLQTSREPQGPRLTESGSTQ